MANQVDMDTVMVTLSDLRHKRDLILQTAARHGADNVRVFGSVASGRSGPASDIDLLVRLAPDRSLVDHIALAQDLEEALGCSVDVVNERALHRLLRERVLAEAVSL